MVIIFWSLPSFSCLLCSVKLHSLFFFSFVHTLFLRFTLVSNDSILFKEEKKRRSVKYLWRWRRIFFSLLEWEIFVNFHAILRLEHLEKMSSSSLMPDPPPQAWEEGRLCNYSFFPTFCSSSSVVQKKGFNLSHPVVQSKGWSGTTSFTKFHCYLTFPASLVLNLITVKRLQAIVYNGSLSFFLFLSFSLCFYEFSFCFIMRSIDTLMCLRMKKTMKPLSVYLNDNHEYDDSNRYKAWHVRRVLWLLWHYKRLFLHWWETVKEIKETVSTKGQTKKNKKRNE